jgi:hypothetical protein
MPNKYNTFVLIRLGTREGDPSHTGMKTCTMGKAGDNPGMSSGSNSRHPRNVNFFPFLCAHSVGK